jgi:hypothetical protein
MRSVKIALGGGLALLAIALLAVLSHSPLTVAGANGIEAPHFRNGGVAGGSSSCQPGGTVPRGTSAIRISLGANVNPTVSVQVLSGSRVITHGERPAGGALSASATVPVTPVAHTVNDTRLCIKLGPSGEVVGIRAIGPPQGAGERIYPLQDVELGAEYLRPGSSSWWSRIPSIADRFGLGRAAGGTWIGFLAIAIMLGVAILAARLTLRELG